MVSEDKVQAPQEAPVPANDVAAVSAAPVDQDALDIKALARGVLARDFRPRVSTVRRLAEAVLTKDAKAKKKKSGKSGAKSSGKSGKSRKLARIPGQKNKKKG